jgi:hypothetical protein
MRKILRKVKEGIKKAVSRRPKGRKVHARVTKIKPPRATKRKPTTAKTKVPEEKVPIEVTVGESKFYTPPKIEEAKKVYPELRELPAQYGQDRIVLQVRDPWWIHAYWDVTETTWERLKQEFPSVTSGGFKRILRVYDISQIIFNGSNAHRYFDIEITPEANNWYIDTQGPGRSWCVDLGLLLNNDRFITIVRSNTVSTPLDGPSWITDEEWMIPEEMFAKLYGMGVGMGSSPLKLKELWKERLKREFASGAVSSIASPVIKREKAKEFWLMVNTELIIYGQTEPDAKLTVGDQPVNLKPDGSFSLRFFLPDGKQVIPVVATSSDGEQVRNITPIVTKETR